MGVLNKIYQLFKILLERGSKILLKNIFQAILELKIHKTNSYNKIKKRVFFNNFIPVHHFEHKEKKSMNPF